MTCNRNCRICTVSCRYNHLLCSLLKVACIIGNGKCNVVHTIGQNNFIWNHITGWCGRTDRITINIYLRCSIIQSGRVINTGAGCIISDCCRKCCIVRSDCISIKCSNINRSRVYFHIADNWHIAIAYNRTVVKSNIINKERDFLIEFTVWMNNKFNKRRIQIICPVLSAVMHITGKIGRCNVCINIGPAALRNTGICHSVICYFFVSHHDFAVCSFPGSSTVCTCRPQNTGTYIDSIFRNIHPHTDTAAGVSVCYISQHFVIVDNIKINKIRISPTAAGGILGRIQCKAKRILSVLYISVFFCCKKCIGTETALTWINPSTWRFCSRILCINAVPCIITKPIGNIAILKVIENIWSLAKSNFHLSFFYVRILVLCINNGWKYWTFLSSNKFQTFKRSCSSFWRCKRKAIFIYTYAVITVCCIHLKV